MDNLAPRLYMKNSGGLYFCSETCRARFRIGGLYVVNLAPYPLKALIICPPNRLPESIGIKNFNGYVKLINASTFGLNQSSGLLSLSKSGVRMTFPESISIPIPISTPIEAENRKLS